MIRAACRRLIPGVHYGKAETWQVELEVENSHIKSQLRSRDIFFKKPEDDMSLDS